MSKYKYEGYGVIRDTEIDFPYHTDDIVELLDEKDQNTANLEAKLAECENERELDNSFWKQKCDGLQKALAEKTLTIEQINKAFIGNCSLWKGKYERANQDKISFTIEQLEKVKEFFLEEHRDEEMDTDYIITKDAGEIADYILDQIKQLKEGK